MDLAGKSVGLASLMTSRERSRKDISDFCAGVFMEVKWEHE